MGTVNTQSMVNGKGYKYDKSVCTYHETTMRLVDDNHSYLELAKTTGLVDTHAWKARNMCSGHERKNIVGKGVSAWWRIKEKKKDQTSRESGLTRRLHEPITRVNPLPVIARVRVRRERQSWFVEMESVSRECANSPCFGISLKFRKKRKPPWHGRVDVICNLMPMKPSQPAGLRVYSIAAPAKCQR